MYLSLSLSLSFYLSSSLSFCWSGHVFLCGILGSWIPGTFFSPGTFTRFARFLHNFTQFLRNFTRFLRFLRDFNAIFAIFTLFFARHKMSDPRHQKLFSRPGRENRDLGLKWRSLVMRSFKTNAGHVVHDATIIVQRISGCSLNTSCLRTPVEPDWAI